MENDQNEKYRVASLKCGEEQIGVYLLNPGDVFAGFGGSRSGLLVRKTASLIVQRIGAMGQQDTEYDIAHKPAWEMIFRNYRP